MHKLWGDNYFNSNTKKWTTHPTAVNDKGDMTERAFCSFVLDPIYKLFDAIMNTMKEETEKLLKKLDITLKSEIGRASCRERV